MNKYIYIYARMCLPCLFIYLSSFIDLSISLCVCVQSCAIACVARGGLNRLAFSRSRKYHQISHHLKRGSWLCSSSCESLQSRKASPGFLSDIAAAETLAHFANLGHGLGASQGCRFVDFSRKDMVPASGAIT